jgi:1-acyl-sn-glycerol-3-phosphate acyltransferase
MVRVLFTVPLIAVDTVLFCGVALLVGAVDRTGRACRWLGLAWARVMLAGLGVRVDVVGTEHLPRGPAVYASNHASALDIPILFGHLPVDFRIIHKRSLYLVPLLGWVLYLAGHVGIDRGNPFRARRSLEEAAARLRRGMSVVVFPEGTRSLDGAVQPFKRGSFVLALDAQVPVVPLSIRGVKRLAPHGLPSLRAGTVHIAIHPPIETGGRDRAAADALAEEVRRVVAGGCREAA